MEGEGGEEPPAHNPQQWIKKEVNWIQLIAAFHLGRNQWINLIQFKRKEKKKEANQIQFNNNKEIQ